MLAMPLAHCLIRKQRAGKIHLERMYQTQARAGNSKPIQAMLRCIPIGFGDAFDAPIRCSKRAKSPTRLFLIQRIDKRTDRHGFIIAM